jgi:hypothetical protein
LIRLALHYRKLKEMVMNTTRAREATTRKGECHGMLTWWQPLGLDFLYATIAMVNPTIATLSNISVMISNPCKHTWAKRQCGPE